MWILSALVTRASNEGSRRFHYYHLLHLPPHEPQLLAGVDSVGRRRVLGPAVRHVPGQPRVAGPIRGEHAVT